MRIVIDTNVITSAVYFGGKPFELLHLVMEQKVNAYASESIVNEYEEILLRLQGKYPGLSRKIPFQDLIARFHIINVKSDLQVCRDPDDDKFISCAVDGRCVYIVSGDKDLLDLKEHEGIEIVTVAEFLERF